MAYRTRRLLLNRGGIKLSLRGWMYPVPDIIHLEKCARTCWPLIQWGSLHPHICRYNTYWIRMLFLTSLSLANIHHFLIFSFLTYILGLPIFRLPCGLLFIIFSTNLSHSLDMSYPLSLLTIISVVISILGFSTDYLFLYTVGSSSLCSSSNLEDQNPCEKWGPTGSFATAGKAPGRRSTYTTYSKLTWSIITG